MLDRSNELKQSYQKYESSQIWRLVQEIAADRREQLQEEIRARAAVMGTENSSALKAALKHLGK